jgi:hypothetical protein
MKTLWKIVGSLLMIMGWLEIFAQDCEPYYIDSQGAVIEMASYDKKDKLTGTSISTVKEVKSEGNKVEWTINVVTKDDKGKEQASGDLNMWCEDGIFKMDMKNFIDDEMLKGFEGMEVTMDATDLEYPRVMVPGQTLPDGSLTISVGNQGMTMMSLVVKIYDRKVEAIEDMTTPAGTFSCYKMTQTIETKTMFKTIAKSTDWMAKKIGTVRSETYDKDGKLMSYMVLNSVKM